MLERFIKLFVASMWCSVNGDLMYQKTAESIIPAVSYHIFRTQKKE
jgi:hypothetical protein